MRESTIDRSVVPAPPEPGRDDGDSSSGCQKLLAQMIQQEVDDWLADRANLEDEQGRHQVVRNGFLPKREIVTGVGAIEVQQPRAGPPPTRPSRAFHLEDLAALPAKDQEHGRIDSLALPEGRQHGRLRRCPEGLGGTGMSGFVGDDGHT